MCLRFTLALSLLFVSTSIARVVCCSAVDSSATTLSVVSGVALVRGVQGTPSFHRASETRPRSLRKTSQTKAKVMRRTKATQSKTMSTVPPRHAQAGYSVSSAAQLHCFSVSNRARKPKLSLCWLASSPSTAGNHLTRLGLTKNLFLMFVPSSSRSPTAGQLFDCQCPR